MNKIIMQQQIQNILKNKSLSLIQRYFKLQKLFEKRYGKNTIGYSAIDITTGICYFSETYKQNKDLDFIFDEISNYINMHKTNEAIITFANKNIQQNKFLQHLELTKITYHINTFRPTINEQNNLLKDAFDIQSLLTAIEHLNMEHYILASESLAILIDFIATHNSSICQKISHPIKLDLNKYLYLGNNALKQLDILHISYKNNIFKLIDNTSTAMGKRLLKKRLSHPIKNMEELEKRYELSNNLYDFHTPIEEKLTNIYDLERLTRRIKLNKLYPDEISNSTETNSSTNITASAILRFTKLKSIFIFATHLHQLSQLEELKKLKNIICLHLSIKYENIQDKLVFDRKLSFGSGSSTYGLEFAKSLHMNKEFLDTANAIRKKITNNYNSLKLYTNVS
jgi:DNA mismatch repair ATPase MutS